LIDLLPPIDTDLEAVIVNPALVSFLLKTCLKQFGEIAVLMRMGDEE
jgi:hypothetical protein